MFLPVKGACLNSNFLKDNKIREKLLNRGKYLDAKPPLLQQEAVSHLIKSKKMETGEKIFFSDEKPSPLMVVTGQQPLLLTGPLFTIYKALSSIRLARQMAKMLQRPVVPLFWVATEDHDLHEVGQLLIPSENGRLQKVALAGMPQGLPLGEMPLQEECVHQVAGDLADALSPQAAYKNDLIQFVYEKGVKATSPGEWFVHILSFLMGGEEIYFYDPYPGVKKGIYKDLIKEVWQKNNEINEALVLGENDLREAGRLPQVKRDGRETHLMITFQGKRRALLKDKTGIFTRDNKFFFSINEIEDLIEKAPSLFTPNVLLRPIFQDFLFSTLCYVAGPGEMGYSQQIKHLYKVFHLEPPVMMTRSGITMIDKNLAFLEEKGQLPLQNFFDDNWQRDLEGLSQKEKTEVLKKIFPKNKLQERVYNFSYYWAQYGPSAWDSFIKSFPQEPAHYLYYW